MRGILACLLILIAAWAISQEWQFLVESETGNKFYVKDKTSFDHAKYGPVLSGVYRREVVSIGVVEQYRVFVRQSDCDSGRGRLEVEDMNGQSKGSVNWRFRGEKIGSYIAEAVCY